MYYHSKIYFRNENFSLSKEISYYSITGNNTKIFEPDTLITMHVVTKNVFISRKIFLEILRRISRIS